MGVGSEHEVEESGSKIIEIGVDIGTRDIIGGMSSGEVGESGSGVGDDYGESDKRGVGFIRVSR